MSFFRLFLLLLMMAAIACGAGTRREKVGFTDYSGHQYSRASDSLDVPYVPTTMKVVRTMLDLGSVGPDDFLIDLGSGDGRVVITAAKEYGARGFGVDLNDGLVALSKKYAAAEGVAKKVDFFVRDIFKTDLREASVITMYLLADINIRMRPKLLTELKPGARIVSHEFHMGDWHPDQMVQLKSEKFYLNDTPLYLWIVPADVAGRWRWRLSLAGEDQSFDLILSQGYQNISGEAKTRNQNQPIFDAGLKGDQIHFSLLPAGADRTLRHDYQGRVQGDTIFGSVQLKDASEKVRLEWQAKRVPLI